MLKIHTFEMVKNITTDEINMLIEKFNNTKFNKGNRYMCYTYTGMCGQGVTIWIMRYIGKTDEIILRINPQTVLGMDGKITLFEISDAELKRCLVEVERILEKCHIKLRDFRISRIDFTRDIQFDNPEVVGIIIKLLRKTGAPYRYKVTKYGGTEYKSSYDINNGCDSVAVYNKWEQYRSIKGEKHAEIMKGVMRVEVRTAVERDIYTNGFLHYRNVIRTEQYAELLIRNVFIDGFYIKTNRMKKILESEYNKKNTGKREKSRINKTWILIEGIAIHRSLQDCIRGEDAYFGYNTIQNIQNDLRKRRLNMVTISASESIQVIPDIKYLLGMKDESEMRKDYEFLVRNHLENKVPRYHIC